jgi:orotidine-5'-phosphate decarboxylase
MNQNKNFSQKFKELALKRSPFCLGIDPTEELIKAWGLDFNPFGLKKMCEIILEAAEDNLALVKPQSAYFERFGPEGMVILQDMSKKFQQRNTLVLFDAKRGDIDSTTLSYAKAYLGKESPYNFDAITATTYMGFEALHPLLNHAIATNCAIFIVVRSSNKEGKIMQEAIIKQDHDIEISVADYLAKQIKNFNVKNFGQKTGAISVVMGATLKNNEISSTLSNLGNCLILTPGIGHQGATIEDLMANYPSHIKQLIPTSSRAVLARGPNMLDLKAAIKESCQESFKLISS